MEKFDFNELPRKSNCMFVSDRVEEKLSGGFYDQNYIKDGRSTQYDPYFAIIYLLEGEGRFFDYLGRPHQMKPGALFVWNEVLQWCRALAGICRCTSCKLLQESDGGKYSSYRVDISGTWLEPSTADSCGALY